MSSQITNLEGKMKLFRIIAVLSILLFAVVNAQAASAQGVKPTPYIGGKLGLMMVDGSGFDDAINAGALVGMTLNQVQAGSLAVEAELTLTLVDGEISGGPDWDVTTLAGYGVYRSNGPIYFKGKAGLVYWDFDLDGFRGSSDDIDLSIGIGGGLKISDKAALELEYTIIESDLDFLSVGFKINF